MFQEPPIKILMCFTNAQIILYETSCGLLFFNNSTSVHNMEFYFICTYSFSIKFLYFSSPFTLFIVDNTVWIYVHEHDK